MRSLAEAWPDEEILQQLVAKLPWRHNVRVLDRIKDRPTREWYLRAALEYGWSRDVLVLQIKSRLHDREGIVHISPHDPRPLQKGCSMRTGCYTKAQA